jgi:hypothetical protein
LEIWRRSITKQINNFRNKEKAEAVEKEKEAVEAQISSFRNR